jgi:hypothetical protein
MKLNSLFQSAKVTAATLAGVVAMTACGGGGSGAGSVSTGGVYFTHEQLAAEFVSRAYTDAGITLTLQKTDTQQTGYIVVNDYYGTQAVYIDGWAVGQNISTYINSQTWYNVSYIGSNLYQDAYGYVYSVDTEGTKDLAKMEAIKQGVVLKKSADHIQSQFGLSADRSLAIARLAVYVKNNQDTLSHDQIDSVVKEISGSTVAELQSAQDKHTQGDDSAVNALINKAAAVNGVGTEHVQQIMSMVIPSAK